MGCVSTKLVPESPPNAGHLVKTVYPPGESFTQTTKTGKHQHHGGYAGHHTRGDNKWTGTGGRQKDYQANDPPTRTTKKVAKYKAKFDPRVTAKYDIKALIGRGSFSRVVRVEHTITKQPYAIKMVDSMRGKEVCESELNVLRRVRHSNIIQLIEVFESRDKLYMVMELATGGELFDRIIAKGSFTERDATTVLSMVLDGIRYLHSLGITHRDLKPENLLYYHPGHDSKILITDFGLSAFRKSGDTYMNTTCGTPEYIAPEILLRKPYTCQVDLWAVGVITYILLSGTMPFDDENRTRLYRLILKAKFSYSGETKSLVTGGEDAMLCLWKTEHQEQPTCPADTLKAKSRLKSNRKHEKRLSDDRPTNSTPNTSSSSAGMGICGSKMQSHDNTDRRKMESPEEIKLMESEEEDSDDHSDSQEQVVNWEDRSLMYEGDNDCYITSIRKPWDISCVVLSDDEVPSEA